MKKRVLYLILPILTIILELLPYGAVCNFANPEGEPWRETFSYFDMVPFGYANFAPLITGVLSVVILLLMMIFFFTGSQKLAAVAKILLIVCAVISLGPLVFGIRYFSIVGALITATLIAELLLLLFAVKPVRN